jgi:cell division protein FtsW
VTSTAPPRRAAAPRRAADRPRPLAWLDGPLTSSHLVFGAGGMLLAIGLVMVFSASSIEAALAHEPAWAPGVQQVVWALIGLVAMFVALRLPTGRVRRLAPVALLVVVLLLLVVLVPGIGRRINGARGWIGVGPLTVQPLELAKLVFAVWGAHVLALRERYLTTRSLLVPVVPVFLGLSLLVILEPDFNGVVCLLLVLVGLLWAGGAGWRIWAGLAGLAVAGVAGLITLAPYRAARITSFLDPFSDPTDGGFQAIRGMYALASGGFWGVGLGNSRMKWDLLPHAESDYIFAIIGEELGFLGCLVVVCLYGVLAYAGFRIARRSTDRFIQLASVAITVWLVGQAAMNMGYVVGILPVTGVTLPLISAGGTSLVLTLFIVGLLARFARTEPAAVEELARQQRSRLSRLLLPAPAAAVDPVRPRRTSAPPARPAARAVRADRARVVPPPPPRREPPRPRREPSPVRREPPPAPRRVPR